MLTYIRGCPPTDHSNITADLQRFEGVSATICNPLNELKIDVSTNHITPMSSALEVAEISVADYEYVYRVHRAY